MKEKIRIEVGQKWIAHLRPRDLHEEENYLFQIIAKLKDTYLGIKLNVPLGEDGTLYFFDKDGKGVFWEYCGFDLLYRSKSKKSYL